jgi:hypothetical protein
MQLSEQSVSTKHGSEPELRRHFGASAPLKGRNEVSKKPFARSTTPLDSGSKGFNCTSRVARVPQNPATSASLPRRPIPVSLSHSSRFGIAPSCSHNSDHSPASGSGVVGDGTIRAVMNRENDATITNTGAYPTCPAHLAAHLKRPACWAEPLLAFGRMLAPAPL